MHPPRPARDGHREGGELSAAAPGGPVLAAREERWRRRLAMAGALGPGSCLLCATLRLPAPLRLSRRYDELVRRAARFVAAAARAEGIPLLVEELRSGGDGPEAYLGLACPPGRAKFLALDLEEGPGWGGLVDLDVMGPGGLGLGRAELGLPARACLVCGGEAAACSAGRAHAAGELAAAAESRIAPLGCAAAPEAARRVGEAALEALLEEAATEPKPGLVCPSSRGAHGDMDYSSFRRSAAALGPWLEELARLGLAYRGEEPSGLMPSLRAAGLAAERDMLAATGGANSHKGAIFSLGLLCAAAGLLRARGEAFSAESCAELASRIASGVSERDFAAARAKGPAELSHGERLHLERGVLGARGEAERGFPSVVGTALLALNAALAAGLSGNDARVEALLALCAAVEDSNLLARGGAAGAALARREASLALAAGGMATEAGRAAVGAMRETFARENLSPGGCADLLAAACMLRLLEKT